MALPPLQSTLLSEILDELPEETAQVQAALLAISAKYRSDLHAQLRQTHAFQEHVTRTHEKVHRKLKRTARVLEQNGHALKADVQSLQAGKQLCGEVERLSKDVMGKLMGLVEALTEEGANVDGDKYPLLKNVVGQEGFEVVEIPESIETHSQSDNENGSNGGDEEMEETSTGEVSQRVTSDVSDALQSVSLEEQEGHEDVENGEEESESHETSQDGTSTHTSLDNDEDHSSHEPDEDHSNGDGEDDTSDGLCPVPESENVGGPMTGPTSTGDNDEDDAPRAESPQVDTSRVLDGSLNTNPSATPSSSPTKDELRSMEATIVKYKAKKLRSFPLPTTPSPSSSAQLSTTSTTSVQGTTYTARGANSTSCLNESLRKFI